MYTDTTHALYKVWCRDANHTLYKKFLYRHKSRLSLLTEVSICAGKRMRRSDTSSVHDRGRVKPVCKTSSETGLGKQIVRMLRAELRCNDIARSGHFELYFMLFESALSYVIDIFKDETVKAVTEEQKKAIFSVLSGQDTFVCLQTGVR